VTDEKKKQIAMDMLKRGFGIQEIALLTNWTDEAIKKLKEEIENQESKKIVDEKQKQIAMDMLKRGFGIQEIALLTNWIDETKKLKEATMNQKFESALDLEYQIELDSGSQQLKVEDALVRRKPSYETLSVY
jgi:GTP cyclohydrolase II